MEKSGICYNNRRMAAMITVQKEDQKIPVMEAQIIIKEVDIMYKEKLDAYIDAHKEEMLEDLKTLVRIDSQRGEAQPGKPFGEGPAKVLDTAEEMMKKYGFSTKNYDHYVVTADFSDQEKKLDILAHLDVVPVTKNWKETEPFEPVIKDGKIYGRGTADDKGPAIAALYAMRAVKECGVPLKNSIRLILGSDEECGSGDLAYYYAKEKEAPMTFTPDADFPVINLEKGRLQKEFSVKLDAGSEGVAVVKVQGGTKVNVVPDTAVAVVRGMKKAEAEKYVAEMSGHITYLLEESAEGVEITAKGLAAHASTPEAGHNAICGLASLLAALPLDTGSECWKVIAEMFPNDDFYGEALKVNMEDEISGKLTMNLGILNYDGSEVCGVFDSRIPVCGSDETVTAVLDQTFTEKGFTIEEGKMIAPHYVPADSELVQKLLASYEAYSGIKGEPQSTGGGTYVHDLERGVAFGCMVPEVDNHMHGDDEFMVIDMLMMSAKIFADAIVRICG